MDRTGGCGDKEDKELARMKMKAKPNEIPRELRLEVRREERERAVGLKGEVAAGKGRSSGLRKSGKHAG